MSAISDCHNPDPDAATAVCPQCGGALRGRLVEGLCARCLLGIAREPEALQADSPSPPELPAQFGRYAIRRQLGRGAMGVVYLAKDSELDRLVAIKVPQFGVGNESAVAERFRHEVRAAAAIHHPNICPIYDVDEFGGTLFMTMAYIEGRPLSVFAESSNGLSLTQTAYMVRKLALALHAAHERGVIHRDLKPANVMIDRRGEPVIMDFGLACRRDPEELAMFDRGAIVGTPAYMSPEQAAGREATVASDQYSLGVILFELVTGQLPFDGDLDSLRAKIASQPPPAPSEIVPGIPAALERICLTALQKEPEDRFASLDQLACELTRFLVSGDVRPTSQPEPPAECEAAVAQPSAPNLSPAVPRRTPQAGQRQAMAAVGLGVGITVLLLAGFAVSRSRPFARSNTPVLSPAGDLAAIEPVDTVAAADRGPAVDASQGDPFVNTLLGRYYCFNERDWETGARYLAKGDDEALKSVAQQDLAAASADEPGRIASALELADAWREVALVQPNAGIRAAMNERAEYWYRQARDALTGPQRDRVDQWLSSWRQTRPGDATVETPAPEPEPDRVASSDSMPAGPTPAVPSPGEPLVAGLPPTTKLPLKDEPDNQGPLSMFADPPETLGPFDNHYLQLLRQIETQRREMLAELRELMNKRDVELPAQYVKASGEYAQLVRVGEDLASDLQVLHQRHGELLRRQSFAQDPRTRVEIQYQLDNVRPVRARAMQHVDSLWAEAKEKRELLQETERSMKDVQAQIVDWSQDAKQLVIEAFWSSEPTGTLSADGYDAMAVMFSTWQSDNEFHPATLALRALARCHQGSFEQALDDAQRAVHLDPSFGFALAVQGYVKYRLGDSSDGLSDITRAIRLDGKQPCGYLLRSLAYRESGNHEAALADAVRVARMAEAVPWGHALLALEQSALPASHLGDPSEAVANAELACRLSQWQSWFCLDALAAAYAASGRLSDAASAQRKAVAIAPDRFRAECRQRLESYEAQRARGGE